MTPRVLIADDERDVATIVAYGIRMMWPDAVVEIAANRIDALRRVNQAAPDLVMLDVSMPSPDGFAVLEHIRAVSQVLVLMLTAHGATADKVRAFDLGADDYLTEPFDHLELLARLRALLRRMRSADDTADGAELLMLADLVLDPGARQLEIGGGRVALTATETRLREEFIRHAGRAVSHEYLLPACGDQKTAPTWRRCGSSSSGCVPSWVITGSIPGTSTPSAAWGSASPRDARRAPAARTLRIVIGREGSVMSVTR